MESISQRSILPDGPIHLLIDSTSLKVFDAAEWIQEKHAAKSRRTWKKLHLAIDAETGDKRGRNPSQRDQHVLFIAEHGRCDFLRHHVFSVTSRQEAKYIDLR